MFDWNERFATQIELVDTQHKVLVDLVNGLCVGYEQENPSEDMIENGEMLEEALQKLVAYADKHFTEEENLMLENNLDERHIKLHRMEHKSFAYDIQKMSDYYLAEGSLSLLKEKLVSFVTSWLTYHILGIDQLMAAQIFAIQKGATPEEAFEAKHLVTYDSQVARLMLDSVLELWRGSVHHCEKLEEKLAILTPHAQANEFLNAIKLGRVNLNPLFITNANGARLHAVLPIDEYHTLVENMDNLTRLTEQHTPQLTLVDD